MGGGAHQRAPAAVADDPQAAQQEWAGIRATSGGLRGPTGPQPLGTLEEVGIDDRRVLSRVPQPAERDLAEVDPVADQLEDRGPGPQTAAGRAQAALVQPFGDRPAPLVVLHVTLEDVRDDLGRSAIGRQARTVRPTAVAVGVAAHGPLPAAGLALHAGGDAFDDRRPLELGEDAQHLDHHPSGRGGGLEGLGHRLEGDPGVLQLLDQGRELAEVARQAIDPEDEEQVEQSGLRGVTSVR